MDNQEQKIFDRLEKFTCKSELLYREVIKKEDDKLIVTDSHICIIYNKSIPSLHNGFYGKGIFLIKCNYPPVESLKTGKKYKSESFVFPALSFNSKGSVKIGIKTIELCYLNAKYLYKISKLYKDFSKGEPIEIFYLEHNSCCGCHNTAIIIKFGLFEIFLMPVYFPTF